MSVSPIEELIVDELHFEVRRSGRRRTLELIVDRDGDLIIAAPAGLEEALMRQFVEEKKFWLYTKLAEKRARRVQTTDKEFVDGEGFPYLGRSYRLRIVDEQDVSLKLINGRFCLRRDRLNQAREVFVDWYSNHAWCWLEPRVEDWAKRMGVKVTNVVVQDLGFRWGSCSNRARLNFHWATILLPPSIVDYVVVHELAHLIEPHHTTQFWDVVESAMIDFAERKNWLAENGHSLLL